MIGTSGRAPTWATLWLVVVLLAAAWPAAGQQAAATPPPAVAWPRSTTAGTDTTGSTPSDRLRLEPGLVLVPVAEAELDREALARAPVTTVRGFDEVRYGLSELAVHFLHTPFPDEDRLDVLDVVVAARRANGEAQWWRLVLGEDGDRWFLATDPLEPPDGAPPAVAAETPPEPPASVATSDASMPLISVQFGYNPIRQPQTTHQTKHVLLDFRESPPKVVASLERQVQYDCIGACAAYDCGMYGYQRLSCRWDAAAGDFACEEQFTEVKNRGGERTGTRWFHLLSGKRLPSPRARTGPLDLKPSVPATGARVGDTQALELLGPVTLAASLKVGGGRVWLLGMPRLKADFDVDFAIAPVSGGRRGRIEAVGSRFDVRSLPLTEGSEPEAWSPYRGEGDPDGGYMPDVAPAFRVSPVVTTGALTVVRVLVTEGQTQSVHLVGIERTATGLVSDVLPIATSGSVYAACGNNLQPSAAVAMRVATGPLRITLDVEPAYYWHDATEEDEVTPPNLEGEFGCRGLVTMTWAPGKGFEPVSRALTCDQAPRRVVIGAAGTLSSRPMKKADPQDR